jgi:hypothetical protein
MMSMTTRSRRITALGATLVAVLALAGCSFAGNELPTLQREATTQDTLPVPLADDLRDRTEQTVDVDSVRLAGEYAGYSVYLARGIEKSETCLLLLKSTTDWASSCSESQFVMVGTDPGIEARTTMDGVIPKDDGENVRDKGTWVALTDDVIVREVTD